MTFTWKFVASFWSGVDVRSDSACWLWRRGLSNGYPALRVSGRSRKGAQIAWELANGQPFPADRFALHRCDTPACCNPHHIYPGTKADNTRDMLERGRSFWATRTQCSNGHDYSPENTRIYVRDGHTRRACRTCQRGHRDAHRSKALQGRVKA